MTYHAQPWRKKQPRLRLLTGAWCATIALASASGGELPATSKPNVLVIVADDLGLKDIGYNNPNVYTPHLDGLAAQGMTLNQHYSMPQCTPTRVALFTGRYPGRFCRQALAAVNDPVFPKGTSALATLFKSAGYDTVLSGKWHMGCMATYGPNHFGFDESYGSLSGAVGMYDHRYRTSSPYAVTWHRDLEIIPGYENGRHATDLVAEEAIRQITRKRENPFFMYLAFHAPHTPLDERGDFVDSPTQRDPKNPTRWLNEDKIKWFHDPAGKIQRETDPEKRLFLAVVHHLDSAIGEVVEALKRSGKWDNTLIAFTSDNGPQVNWGGNAYPNDLKLSDFNQPSPLHGSKCDVWEGGIHVPGFVVWPKRIKPGTTLDNAVHVVDWFPTFAALLGATAPVKPALDGRSLLPVITGKKELAERDLYWIWNAQTDRWALRLGDWKIVKYGKKQPKASSDWQLYNLASDPYEKTNRAAKHPDVVAKLHALFLKQRSKDSPNMHVKKAK